MPKSFIVLLSIITILASCTKSPTKIEGDSRWIVIYKYEIAPNNEVVWLTRNQSASHPDALSYLERHCEDLRILWSKQDGEDYFCSTKVFPGRAPKLISSN